MHARPRTQLTTLVRFVSFFMINCHFVWTAGGYKNLIPAHSSQSKIDEICDHERMLHARGGGAMCHVHQSL